MESMLPPDPYKALGVARDADIALIKKTFRKLALSCHPDKLPAGIDEALKQKKQDEFHKINEAYVLIGDETSRQRYDDEYKLEQLRSEKLARGGAKVSERTGSYGIRTQAPASAAGDAYTAKSSRDYETRSKPARAATYDDRYDDRSRKGYDPYEGSSYTKPKTTSRSSREEIPIKIVRSSTDRTRSDHKKSRDKEERRERERRFVAPESDSDEKRAYERDWKRRSDDATRAKEEEEARRKFAEARKKADEGRRSYEDKYDRQGRRSDDDKYERPDRERKIVENVNDAVRHIYRSRVEAERPSPSRTSSSRDVPQYHESRSRRDRPEAAPRRSSARPKDSPTSGRERDRKAYEIVDWDSGDAKLPPSFSKSSSSPAEIHVPRATPQRSYTESSSSRDYRRDDTSPTPKFRRASTMDTRRTEAPVSRPSGLRESVTAYSRNSSPESYPRVPQPKIRSYKYDTPGGGVSVTPEDISIANGHRAIFREPDSHRKRSTSPVISKPPMGVNRPVDPSSGYEIPVVAPRGAAPPLSRSATTSLNVKPVRATEERNRDLYYGEIPSSKDRRENRGRQPTSYAPDQISYASRPGPEDIQWSPYTTRGRDGGADRDREFVKPGLSRASTSVY
jgi:curved DNA-binding protein CbpA